MTARRPRCGPLWSSPASGTISAAFSRRRSRGLRTARRATVLFTAREAALRAAKAAGFQVVLVGPGHPAEASALADVTVSDYLDMIRVER